jgi:hypothetical protein
MLVNMAVQNVCHAKRITLRVWKTKRHASDVRLESRRKSVKEVRPRARAVVQVSTEHHAASVLWACFDLVATMTSQDAKIVLLGTIKINRLALLVCHAYPEDIYQQMANRRAMTVQQISTHQVPTRACARNASWGKQRVDARVPVAARHVPLEDLVLLAVHALWARTEKVATMFPPMRASFVQQVGTKTKREVLHACLAHQVNSPTRPTQVTASCAPWGNTAAPTAQLRLSATTVCQASINREWDRLRAFLAFLDFSKQTVEKKNVTSVQQISTHSDPTPLNV